MSTVLGCQGDVCQGDDAAGEARLAQALREDVAADRVEDDVGAPAPGEAEHLGHHRVAGEGGGVDGVVGAESGRPAGLLRAAGGRDHPGAGPGGDLDGGAADAAGRRLHDDRLALLGPGPAGAGRTRR